MTDRKIEFKKLTQDEVDAICARHERLWSGRSGGARANFSYTILENMVLVLHAPWISSGRSGRGCLAVRGVAVD